MFVILWRFVVRPDRVDAFVDHYRNDGSWARLFRTSAGYRGTELIRATSEPATFITVDRWDSPASFEEFKRERHHEYERLDAECQSLTVREELIGEYVTDESSDSAR
jgi:heme-degrading monooxygenase HmoA